MTNMTEGDEVLKTDVLGRVKTPPERREVLLDEFERSGVSGREFAVLVGMNYQTFASWVQKRRRARGQYPLVAGKPVEVVRKPGKLRLIQAVIASGSARDGGAGLWVQLPGGARVEVQDARQVALVAELLWALGARSC